MPTFIPNIRARFQPAFSDWTRILSPSTPNTKGSEYTHSGHGSEAR